MLLLLFIFFVNFIVVVEVDALVVVVIDPRSLSLQFGQNWGSIHKI